MTSRLRRMMTPSNPSAKSRKLTVKYCSSPTCMLIQVFFAQQNHANHGDEQEYRNDFKRHHILPKQQGAERLCAAFHRGRRVRRKRCGMETFQEKRQDGAYRDNSRKETVNFYFTHRFGF